MSICKSLVAVFIITWVLNSCSSYIESSGPVVSERIVMTGSREKMVEQIGEPRETYSGQTMLDELNLTSSEKKSIERMDLVSVDLYKFNGKVCSDRNRQNSWGYGMGFVMTLGLMELYAFPVSVYDYARSLNDIHVYMVGYDKKGNSVYRKLDKIR